MISLSLKALHLIQSFKYTQKMSTALLYFIAITIFLVGNDSSPVFCKSDHFCCEGWDGIIEKCIPNSAVCNGHSDCSDSSDEKGSLCNGCNETGLFRCNRYGVDRCIVQDNVCDGHTDCDNYEEEQPSLCGQCEDPNMFR